MVMSHPLGVPTPLSVVALAPLPPSPLPASCLLRHQNIVYPHYVLYLTLRTDAMDCTTVYIVPVP